MRELLLASFDGIQYGIWKDEIRSVKSIDELHRIPLSSKNIAGIMMDGERVVMLADLSACLGFDNSVKGKEGTILVMSDDDTPIGFVVHGELRSLSIQPASSIAMPDFLKTAVFGTCVINDARVIPIIDLSALYSIVTRSGEVILEGSCKLADVHDLEVSSIRKFRTIYAGNEPFFLSADNLEYLSVKPGPITPLPYTPPHVIGISCLNERLLPVIDLSLRVVNQITTENAQMLIAKVGDSDFGLLIDKDGETVTAEEVTIKVLPPITQQSWMKHVLLIQEKIIPLVDVSNILNAGSENEVPVWQRYVSGPGFGDVFLKQEVDVVEFFLLGERHALPKTEVEDVIPYKHGREISKVPPIVLGVLEHNGKVLPVLDLAMMFGRRSIINESWKMMLIRNGDFRALVITEKVLDERHLLPEVQKKVPIHLPHDLMYGCYPVENSVRLILNIKSIAVHFDSSIVQIMLPALSQEMKMSPTGQVFDFRDDQSADQHPEEGVENGDTSAGSEQQPVYEAIGPSIEEVQNISSDKELDQDGSGEWREWGSEDEALDVESGNNNTETLPTEEIIFPETETEAGIDAIEFPEDDVHQYAESIHISNGNDDESIHLKNSGTVETDQQEHESILELTDPEPEELEEVELEPERLMSQKPALDELESSSGYSTDADRVIHEDILVSDVNVQPLDSESHSDSFRQYEPVRARAVNQIYKELLSVRNRRKLYASTAAVFILAIFIVWISGGTSERDIGGKLENKAIQTGNQQIAADKEGGVRSDRAEPVQVETARNELVQPIDKTPALELEIPKSMPVDIDIYVVVKGDTLWSISERFTGSPYNYPRIAGENRIAEPDLIFPGQRIKLIK